MIYKYEMACKEAGLSEEQTAEIRRFFDAEKKRLKRDKKAREEEGITFSYVVTSEEESEEAGDLDSREIVDENYNLEEIVLHNLMLEQLHNALQELSADDREFLLSLYADDCDSVASLARTLGVPRTTLIYRKEQLLKRLKKMIEEN